MMITKRLNEIAAIEFLQNMRWFSGHGRIVAKRIKPGIIEIRATQSAWSMFVLQTEDLKGIEK